ncbi:MAG: hypothetical protein PHD72_01340 [Patescibacteria group bacterium]|nr:hypothetical protein [Patescibacteria group bacterium]
MSANDATNKNKSEGAGPEADSAEFIKLKKQLERVKLYKADTWGQSPAEKDETLKRMENAAGEMLKARQIDPEKMAEFQKDYADLGLEKKGPDGEVLEKLEQGIERGRQKLMEYEESRREYAAPEYAALLPKEFKEKLENFQKNMDAMANALKRLERKKDVVKNKVSSGESLAAASKTLVLNDLDDLKTSLAILESNFRKVEKEITDRADLESRLRKLEQRLAEVKKFESTTASSLAKEMLKQLPKLHDAEKLDATAVAGLEEMAENRIFKVEKSIVEKRKTEARDYALPGVKEFVQQGLVKNKERLEFLLDAYTGMDAGPDAKRKSAIATAHDLSYELADDLKNKNVDPKALEIKFRAYVKNLELAEKQFAGPVEKKAIKERGEKLLQRLLSVKNDSRLNEDQKDLVLTWIDSIPKKQSFEDILHLESLAREYVLDVLEAMKNKEEKAAAQAKATAKTEAAWFKRGEEKMGATPVGVKAEVKKTAKEVLTEAGVVEIKPQELLANISEHDAGKLGEFLKKGSAEEAKNLLRDILKEHTSQLAAEQREEVSQQSYEILRATVLAETNRQMAKTSKTGLAKNILKNLGIAAGIGIGAGMVIGSGGAAAMVAAGVIAARPILMKQISESEKFQQAKKKVAESKAGTFWGNTFGKWFKKEEPKNDPNAVLAKTVDAMDIKDQLSAVLANQIRENTSRDVRAKIKTYTEAGRTAMERPSAETEDKFAAALDAASYEFYQNALNYVEVTYAGASAEQKKQAALQITLAIGGYERGEVKAAQALKEIQAKAERPEDKYWLVAKMEELTKVRSENLAGAVGIGVVMAGAIRFSAYGRILSGALGGAAVGLSVEKSTRERGDVKLEKNIAKMIDEAEKKLAGRKVWDIAEADLKKAGDNAVAILSRLDLGLLDKNKVLKNRAENFVAFVNRLKMEKADVAGDSLDKILADIGRGSDRLEKLTQKAKDKLTGDNVKKRQLLFMLGGAVAGGALSYALGVAASEIRDWWKAPAAVATPKVVPEGKVDMDFTKPETLPAEEKIDMDFTRPETLPAEEKIDMDFTKPETLPAEEKIDMDFTRPETLPAEEKIDMDFTKPPETPLIPVEETAGAVKHAVRSIAEIRTLHIPKDSADLYHQVGKSVGDDILKLDEGGYHKVATDLYNAVRRVDLLEHQADTLPAGSPKALDLHHQAEVLRGQLSEAEKVLHSGRRADAADMFRHISRETLQHGVKVEAVSGESLKFPVGDNKAAPIEPLNFPGVDKDVEIKTEPAPHHPIKTFSKHYPGHRLAETGTHLENKPAGETAPAKTPVEQPVEPSTAPIKSEDDFVGPPTPAQPAPGEILPGDYLEETRRATRAAIAAAKESVEQKINTTAPETSAPPEVEKVMEPTPVEKPTAVPPEVKPEETAGAVKPSAKETLQQSLEKQNKAYADQVGKIGKDALTEAETAEADKKLAEQAAEAIKKAQMEEAMDEEQLELEAHQAAQAVRFSLAEEWGNHDAVYGNQLIDRIHEKALSAEQENAFAKLVKRFDSALTHRRGGKSLHTIIESLEKMNK